MHIYEQAVSTGLQTMLMLDIFVLFSLFLLLVGLLGLFQYVQRVSGSCDLALSKKLLQEWLEAHSLTLPDVKSVLAVLNQQLADFESEVSIVEWWLLLLYGIWFFFNSLLSNYLFILQLVHNKNVCLENKHLSFFYCIVRNHLVGEQDLEMVEATKLLPQTQLPVFHLTHAELSTDNTDIVSGE